MSIYPINITAPVTEERLKKGTFLFIYRATRIPPHIGVVTNGMLYDITSVGPNIDLAVEDFYKTSVKRKMEILFVEINLPEADTNAIITEKVKEYWKVNEKTSCLAPVKDFLNEVTGIDMKNVTFLFDLLPVLGEANLLGGVYELNLQKKLKNQVFELKKYTQQDIKDCIVALSRKVKVS